MTYFYVQSHVFFCYPKPLLHPGLSRKGGGQSSVLSCVIRLISEPPRLVRAKACHEKGLFGNFGQSGRLAYPGKKILSERTTGTVQGGFFCPVKPIHPSLSRKVFFGRSSVLSGVIRLISEPPRTEYSGEPEMSRFLVRPKACHEKFRTVRAPGLS